MHKDISVPLSNSPLFYSALRLSLLCVLLLGPVFAHQWLEEHYQRAIGVRTAVFFGDKLQLPSPLAGAGPVRLVHFWDPSCPCSASNLAHLAEIVKHFAPLGVAFYSVQKPGSSGQLPAALSALRALPELAGLEQLPASPAAAIWNAQGELVYIGPYSEGASCSLGNGFVEPILEAVLAGRPVKANAGLAVACFCDWK